MDAPSLSATTENSQAQAVASAIQNARPAGNTGISLSAGAGALGIIVLFVIRRFHAQIDPNLSDEDILTLAGAVTTLIPVAIHFLSHFRVFGKLWETYAAHADS
jgi:hypothetical protein